MFRDVKEKIVAFCLSALIAVLALLRCRLAQSRTGTTREGSASSSPAVRTSSYAFRVSRTDFTNRTSVNEFITNLAPISASATLKRRKSRWRVDRVNHAPNVRFCQELLHNLIGMAEILITAQRADDWDELVRGKRVFERRLTSNHGKRYEFATTTIDADIGGADLSPHARHRPVESGDADHMMQHIAQSQRSRPMRPMCGFRPAGVKSRSTNDQSKRTRSDVMSPYSLDGATTCLNTTR
jgi:hypothetical protein